MKEVNDGVCPVGFEKPAFKHYYAESQLKQVKTVPLLRWLPRWVFRNVWAAQMGELLKRLMNLYVSQPSMLIGMLALTVLIDLIIGFSYFRIQYDQNGGQQQVRTNLPNACFWSAVAERSFHLAAVVGLLCVLVYEFHCLHSELAVHSHVVPRVNECVSGHAGDYSSAGFFLPRESHRNLLCVCLPHLPCRLQRSLHVAHYCGALHSDLLHLRAPCAWREPHPLFLLLQ